MSELVLKDVKVYINGRDLSGEHNNVSLEYKAELLDTTVFGSSFRKRIPGLHDIEFSGQGYTHNSPSTGGMTQHFTNLGTSGVPVSICPSPSSAGVASGSTKGDAYIFNSVEPSVVPMQGSVGEIVQFSMQAQGADGTPLVKAKVLTNKQYSTAVTGYGPVVDLGVPGSTKKLYAVRHIVDSSGKVGGAWKYQGYVVVCASSNFGVAKTTALTFTNSSAIGGEMKSTTITGTTRRWAKAFTSVNVGSSGVFTVAIHAGYK